MSHGEAYRRIKPIQSSNHDTTAAAKGQGHALHVTDNSTSTCIRLTGRTAVGRAWDVSLQKQAAHSMSRNRLPFLILIPQKLYSTTACKDLKQMPLVHNVALLMNYCFLVLTHQIYCNEKLQRPIDIVARPASERPPLRHLPVVAACKSLGASDQFGMQLCCDTKTAQGGPRKACAPTWHNAFALERTVVFRWHRDLSLAP